MGSWSFPFVVKVKKRKTPSHHLVVVASVVLWLAVVASGERVATRKRVRGGSKGAALKSRAVAALAGKNKRQVKTTTKRRQVVSRVDAARQDIESCGDIVYYGDVEIGTPKQKFQVIFDTGSADFWIAAKDCRDCANSLNLYDGDLSSTYEEDKKNFEIEYEDNDAVSGHRSFDVVTLAGDLEAERQGFAEVDTVGDFFICGEEDGLLGMAFSDNLARLQVPTPFETLMNQGQLRRGVFAFDVPSENDDAPGELVFGEEDPDHFLGDLQYVQLHEPRRGFWQIDVANVTMGGGTELPSAATAIVDTGTSLMIGKPAAVFQVAKAIGGTCFHDDGSSYADVKPCSDFPSSRSFLFVTAPCSESKYAEDRRDLDLTFTFRDDAGNVATATIPPLYYMETEPCDPVTQFHDCNGLCWDKDPFLNEWNSDDECDDGIDLVDLNCPKFNCDDCADCGTDPVDDACFLGLDGDSSYDFWLLGDTFLTSTYTVFSVEDLAMGFAPSNKELKASNPPGAAPTTTPTSSESSPSSTPTAAPIQSSLSSPPTATPTQATDTTDPPTPTPCEDDSAWFAKGTPAHDCAWVGATQGNSRCTNQNDAGDFAFVACPLACNVCHVATVPPTTPDATPGVVPTAAPTTPDATPGAVPTAAPTAPDAAPGVVPTAAPTTPDATPGAVPTAAPTAPDAAPGVVPTAAPTTPDAVPGAVPTAAPTTPDAAPGAVPTAAPTAPDAAPGTVPTSAPTAEAAPGTVPTSAPTAEAAPGAVPTSAPTASDAAPGAVPTTLPSAAPGAVPSPVPSMAPTTLVGNALKGRIMLGGLDLEKADKLVIAAAIAAVVDAPESSVDVEVTAATDYEGATVEAVYTVTKFDSEGALRAARVALVALTASDFDSELATAADAKSNLDFATAVTVSLDPPLAIVQKSAAANNEDDGTKSGATPFIAGVAIVVGIALLVTAASAAHTYRYKMQELAPRGSHPLRQQMVEISVNPTSNAVGPQQIETKTLDDDDDDDGPDTAELDHKAAQPSASEAGGPLSGGGGTARLAVPIKLKGQRRLEKQPSVPKSSFYMTLGREEDDNEVINSLHDPLSPEDDDDQDGL